MGHHGLPDGQTLQRSPVLVRAAAGLRVQAGAGDNNNNFNCEAGAREACDMVRRLDFEPSQVAFDAAFQDA